MYFRSTTRFIAGILISTSIVGCSTDSDVGSVEGGSNNGTGGVPGSSGNAVQAFNLEKGESDPSLPSTSVRIWKERELRYPENQGVVLGQGWDSVRERPTPTVCIDFVPDKNIYQDSSISVERIYDYEQLVLNTQVTARAQVKSKIAGSGGSGKASLDISNDTNLTTSETNLLVTAEVVNGVRFVKPNEGSIKLAPYADEVIKKAKEKDVANEFSRHCGDSFVARIQDGARVDALYTFRERNFEENRKITSEISGSGTIFGMGGEGGIKSFKNEKGVTSTKITNVQYTQQGGNGTGQTGLPTSLDTILAAVSELPKVIRPKSEDGILSADSGGKPMKLWVVGYQSLPAFPKSAVAPKDPSYEELLARYYLRIEQVQNDVMSMYQNMPYMTQYDKPAAGKTESYASPFFTWDIETALGLDSSRISNERDRLKAKLSEIEELLTQVERQPECYSQEAGKTDDDGTTIQCNTGDKKTGRAIDTSAYIEYIDLPVPLNAVHPDVSKGILDNTESNIESARAQYGALRWYHWVLQRDKVRCEAIGECLSRQQKGLLYQQYLANVGVLTKPGAEGCGITIKEGQASSTFQETVFKETIARSLDDANETVFYSGIDSDDDIDTSKLRLNPIGDPIPKRADNKRLTIFVGKCEEFTVTYKDTAWVSRFYVDRYPIIDVIDDEGKVVGKKIGEKDSEWRQYTNHKGSFRDVGPRSIDYIYEVNFETQFCRGPWVAYGQKAPGHCPAKVHDTTIVTDLSKGGRTRSLVGYLAGRKHRAEVEATTRFVGTVP